MLLDSLDDYPLGGIDEMSARTVSCWSNLTRWFVQGIDKEEKLRDGWGICDVFQAIRARGGAGNLAGSGTTEWSRKMGNYNPLGEGAMLQRSEEELARIQVRTDKFGAEIYTLPPLDYEEAVPAAGEASSPLQQREVLSSARAPKFQDPTYIATYTPYSHFGASMSIGGFSPSGPALAVGAPHETEDSSRPGEGNVYILPLADLLGSPSVSTASQPEYLSMGASGRLQRTEVQNGLTDQRFGASSTALNTLNTALLAVAAPGPYTYDTSTPPSLPFAGISTAGRIDLFLPGKPTRFLSLSIKGAELGSIGQRWWGESMISADLDGTGEFLIVSGSSNDKKRVCEGRTRAQMGEGEVGVFQFVAASEIASSHSEALSFSTRLGDKHVTASGHSTAALTINSWSIPLPESSKSHIPCDRTSTYEYFGHTLSFLPHTRTLLIGAPGAGAHGAVYAYAFANNTFTHTFTLTPPPPPSSPRALRSAFGGSGIATGRTPSGHVWIAIAAASEGVDADLQAGVLRIYLLTAAADDDAPQLIAEVVAAPSAAARRFGRFGRSVVADPGTGGVWVGSEFWDSERGAVWWVDVDALVAAEVAGGRAGLQTVLEPRKVRRVEVEVMVAGAEVNVSGPPPFFLNFFCGS